MIGTFLHSPMLDELKSLETILMEKVCDTARCPRRSTHYSSSSTAPVQCSVVSRYGLTPLTYQPPTNAVQVTGGAATPPKRSVSVRLSDKIGELELVDLPMLPSLESNSSISQCYERVSGSDAEDTREPAESHAELSLQRRREGRHSNRISGVSAVPSASVS